MPTKTPQKKTTEKAAKAAAGGKPNALQQPLRPSEELAAVVGPGPLPRGEVVSKVWEYIKANNLQNPEDRREILADDRLGKLFGTDKAARFEMNKPLGRDVPRRREVRRSVDHHPRTPVRARAVRRAEVDFVPGVQDESCARWEQGVVAEQDGGWTRTPRRPGRRGRRSCPRGCRPSAGSGSTA
jgi:upstream activation factor subunit UAF30